MYIYKIVVRWKNGDLEGFGASALTKDGAYKRAVTKAHSKASSLPPCDCGFDVLSSAEYNALTAEQQDDIQNDWDNERL